MDHEPEPLKPVEALALGCLVAVGLEIVWMLRLALLPPTTMLFRDRLAIPVLLGALPVLICILAPRWLLDRSGLSAVLVLARERGGLAGWDVAIALVAAMSPLCLFFHVGGSGVAAVPLAFVSAAACVLGLMQPRVDFSGRRSRVPVPDWLRDPAGDEAEVVGPDAGARPLYRLQVDETHVYDVGIAIPDPVLARLRQVNAEHAGVFYQSDPLTAVLVDRAPVAGVGREETARLCRQLLSIGRRHRLSRLHFANLVLAFVQRAMTYAPDQDSTKDLPGGPYAEYGRFALETISDGTGDCECTSILCATLLACLGYKTALLQLSVPDERTGAMIGHLAVGLALDGALADDAPAAVLPDSVGLSGGTRFLYGETALDGMTLAFGVMPAEWRDLAQVMGVQEIARR
jgi:hypothetical protein